MKKKRAKAEIARLRHIETLLVASTERNIKLRAALLAAKHGAEYPDELGDIIDAALANEEEK